jgi:mannan endo-1,4-beta-mannosidase
MPRLASPRAGRLALALTLLARSAAAASSSSRGRALLDHDEAWFRDVPEGGAWNALDPSRPLDDQVARTTCLASDAFVRAEGSKFTLGGRDFVFAGWNQWEVLEAASDAPPPFRHLPLPGREHVVRQMNEAVANGLKVVRMWAHTITPGHAMQPEPGAFDEDILEGMDFVMDEARKRGLKIIWAVSDNWYDVGGLNQFVRWSPTARAKEDFFTDAKVHELYVRTFETIATRVNTINGVAYRDDPTIMAWNLANEARCPGCDPSVMQAWIEKTCAAFKAIDANHLIGVGHEGFHGVGSGMEDRNPGNGGSRWAAREGQDFLRNAATPCVDYVGVHVWPDDWNLKTVDFLKKYVEEHARDANEAIKSPKKPFILEEFGKIVDRNDPRQNRENERGGRRTRERDEYFAAGFDVAEKLASEGLLAGTLFWHWYDRGVGPGKYGVRSNDSTWALIEKHAEFMNALGGQRAFCEK